MSKSGKSINNDSTDSEGEIRLDTDGINSSSKIYDNEERTDGDQVATVERAVNDHDQDEGNNCEGVENDDGNTDTTVSATSTHTDTTTATEDSYLPSWVLKMRHKIKESRLEHIKAESRLNSLQVSISNLDINLTTLRSSSRRNSTDMMTSSSSGANSTMTHYSFQFHKLPSDLVDEVLDYLTIDQIVKLECVCSSFKSCTAECPYWERNLLVFCPHKSVNSIARIDLRSEILRHVNQGNQCVEFIIAMKNQRCIQRHNSIEPRRHSKSERGVTHPLPVFESNTSRSRRTSLTGSLGNLGNLGGVGSLGGDMIMSRTETLNADFRSVAHKTLEIMFNITRYSSDPLHERLVCQGAVTVLISLLSNEAGVLQHFSCGVLANLLCWESRMNMIQGPPNASSSSSMIPLAEQLRACGGQGLLIALLTSPSASVNLSGTIGRVSGGLKELRMTASVQGISTKQASRALVTLFSPTLPISAAVTIPYFDNQTEIQYPPDKKGFSPPIGSPPPKGTPPKGTPPIGSPKGVDQFLSTLKTSNSLSKIQTSQSPHSTRSLQSPLSTPNKLPPLNRQSSYMKMSAMMSSHYLGEEFASPWTFNYYHKSGAFKDSFTTYLHFTPDGFIRGRGMDSIGLFYLTGKADIDMSGWTWYFHKTYVSQDVADQPEGGEGAESGALSLSVINSITESDAAVAAPAVGGVVTSAGGGGGGFAGHSAVTPPQGTPTAAPTVTATTSTSTTTTTIVAPTPTIAGDITVDITGTTPAPSATTTGAATPDDSEEIVTLGWGVKSWMERAHLEYRYEGRARTHVSHTGYWAEGTRDVDKKCSPQILGDRKGPGPSSGSPSGPPLGEGPVWGMALWGVWETSSHGSHFELQKGGVFSATPLSFCKDE